MKLKQKVVSLISKTKTGQKIASSQRYRIILSAKVAFAFNLLYALYHCVLGILNFSLWFIAMCAFYGILATMRFSAVLCERNYHKLPTDNTELFVMKISGVLLVVLSIVLATVNYISLSQNIATKYKEIIMITIATYTFYKITMAKSKLVKTNEKIAEKVIGTYQKIEDTVVGGYTKIEDAFIDRYLTKDGETVEEVKKD